MDTRWILPAILIAALVLLGMVFFQPWMWVISPVAAFIGGMLAGRYIWPFCKWHNKG